METQSHSLTVAHPALPALSMEQVVERRNRMVQFIQQAMKRDVDYGTIEGTEHRDKDGNKIPNDTLYKAGAEKLNTFFQFVPRYLEIRTVEDWTGDEHGGEPLFYYWQKCELYRDGVKVGEGDGSCNSWEKKYRYREAQRACPACGKATIFKSKKPAEGFFCWAKKGGCGTTFAENARDILSQQAGQIPNPDIADLPNTILKMAQKRALVAATLVACNASEFFIQDIEDWVIDAEYKVVTGEGEMPRAETNTAPTMNTKPVTSPRPLTPAQLRDALKKKADKNHVNLAPEKLEKMRGLLAGTLQDLCDKNTAKRHELVAALWNVKSLNDLTPAQVSATLDWLALVRDEESGQWTFKDEQYQNWVLAEIAAVLDAALLAKGQQTLPHTAPGAQTPIQDISWDELGGASKDMELRSTGALKIAPLPAPVTIPSKAAAAAPAPRTYEDVFQATGAHVSKSKISRTQKALLMEIFLRANHDDEDAALQQFDALARTRFNKSQYELTITEADTLLEELQAQHNLAPASTPV